MLPDEKFEKKIDSILDKINDINVTLGQQHVSLLDHMKRSDHIEKYVDVVKKQVDEVQKHVYYVQGGIKVLLSMGAVIAGVLLLIRTVKGVL